LNNSSGLISDYTLIRFNILLSDYNKIFNFIDQNDGENDQDIFRSHPEYSCLVG